MNFVGSFSRGEAIRYGAVFHDIANNATDPTSPAARLRKPDGSYTDLDTPIKLDGKTGYFGNTIASSALVDGIYNIRLSGTVDGVEHAIILWFSIGALISGDEMLYGVSFHDELNSNATVDPTATSADLQKADGTWETLTNPAKLDSKTGWYGGAIDTTGFDTGQYRIVVSGTVNGTPRSIEITFWVYEGTAYCTVAYADQYHAARGRGGSWNSFQPTDKQAALLRATDYIDTRFGRWFRGYRESKDQARAFPRIDAYDDDGYEFDDYPSNLQKATAEYGLRALLNGELAPDPQLPVQAQDLSSTTAQSGDVITGVVKSREDSVGRGEVVEKRTFATTAELHASAGKRTLSGLVAGFNIPEYPAADLLIEPLLKPRSRTLERGD